jgi:hypothetical protein
VGVPAESDEPLAGCTDPAGGNVIEVVVLVVVVVEVLVVPLSEMFTVTVAVAHDPFESQIS